MKHLNPNSRVFKILIHKITKRVAGSKGKFHISRLTPTEVKMLSLMVYSKHSSFYWPNLTNYNYLNYPYHCIRFDYSFGQSSFGGYSFSLELNWLKKPFKEKVLEAYFAKHGTKELE